MNKQAYVVAKREFWERVRTKWFAIVTILGPIGMVAAIVIPVFLTIRSAQEGFNIQLIDKSGRDIGSQINVELDAKGVAFKIESVLSDTPRSILQSRIADESIDGYIEIPSDVLSGGKVWYRGDNTANPIVTKSLSRLIDFAVFRTRGKDMGLDDLSIASLFTGVEFETEQTTGDGSSSSGTASFFVGYAVMFLLYMSILLYAVAVLRSVILEKNNRVVEIIVSSIKPMPLMLGKVVGVGCVGLLQLVLWGAMAALIVTFREQVLGLFGLPGAGSFALPDIGIGAIGVIVAYFLMGFFFYASLYAAIGAMVNSEQEAQQAQAPVIIVLMIPVLCVQIVAGDPRGAVAEILTLIPFSSPILMPMRYVLGAVSIGEILLSLAILAVSLMAAISLAAKIYRVGILSYGKKPSFKEVWRWIRSS